MIDALFKFVGYGPPSGTLKFLFLGEKEYTPRDTEWDNCQIRLETFKSPWEDKNVALTHLAGGFAARGHSSVARDFRGALSPGKYFDWSRGAPGSVSVWTWAAMVMAAWCDSAVCLDTGPWFTNWAQQYRDLGTCGGDSALVELYPLPMRSVQAWPPEYHQATGDRDAGRYFQRVFPLDGPSARRTLLEKEAVSRLGADSVAVAYGRGGNGAEFWQRYDLLLDPRPSSIDGVTRRWHPVIERQIEIGIAKRGGLIARVGFPWGRPNGNPVKQAHVPTLVEAMRALKAQN